MPSLEEALALACNLAPDYYAKSMSPFAQLRSSGYLECRHVIDLAKIRDHVAQHPNLIGDWIDYSENKRVSSDWYFSVDAAESPFVVGHFPPDPEKTETSFTDGVEGCAIRVFRRFQQSH